MAKLDDTDSLKGERNLTIQIVGPATFTSLLELIARSLITTTNRWLHSDGFATRYETCHVTHARYVNVVECLA